MNTLNDILVGDVVKIVDKHVPRLRGDRWNENGKMDKWLGELMTVRCICDSHVKMDEDEGEGLFGEGWCWFPEMIECVVQGEAEDMCVAPCDSLDLSGLF